MSLAGRIEKHNLATVEALSSRRDLAAEMLEVEVARRGRPLASGKRPPPSKRGPLKRWRVECGNLTSKLLTRSQAQTTRSKYGGTIVDLWASELELVDGAWRFREGAAVLNARAEAGK